MATRTTSFSGEVDSADSKKDALWTAGGFHLGLALVCRLEEITTLRKNDISKIDGIPVVRIWPSKEHRLKSDSSCSETQFPMHCNQNYSFNGRTENQTAYYLMSQSHRLPIHAEAITHQSGWAKSCGIKQASITRQLSSIPAAIPSPNNLSMQAVSSD